MQILETCSVCAKRIQSKNDIIASLASVFLMLNRKSKVMVLSSKL